MKCEYVIPYFLTVLSKELKVSRVGFLICKIRMFSSTWMKV